MTATHRVVISERAEADLEDIYRFIAERSGQDRARVVVGNIERQCRALDLFPRRGSPRDDLFPGLRIVGHHHRASIAFTIKDSRVTIEAVAWRGRDLAASFGRDR